MTSKRILAGSFLSGIACVGGLLAQCVAYSAAADPLTTPSDSGSPAPILTYVSPEPIIKKEVIHLTLPEPPAAQNLVIPPLPASIQNQALAALAPSAGGDMAPSNVPLIPTTDLLPSTPPVPPPPVEAATTPMVKTVLPPPSSAPVQTGVPLIPAPIAAPASVTAPAAPVVGNTLSSIATVSPANTQTVVTAPPEAQTPAAKIVQEPELALIPPAVTKSRPAPVRKHVQPDQAPGGSALPPQPSISTSSLGQATLPANVPGNAVKRWSGPDAVDASSINTLPLADVSTTAPAAQAVIEKSQQPARELTPADRALSKLSPLVPLPPSAPLPQVASNPPPQTASTTPPQAAVPNAPAQAASSIPLSKSGIISDTTEPKRALSEESKRIVSSLRPLSQGKLGAASKPIFIDHARDLKKLDQPDQSDQPGQTDATATRDASGVKIEIKPPAMNFNYELEKAYNALIAGQSEVAIATYKRVLDNEPNNKNALFGLATAYHRGGQIELARPVYAKLLTVDPENRDGLNNFLVLLADEAPEEALGELQKLAERNPQYSALPAQIAIIYQKLGQYDKAGDYMLRAIEMEPESIAYRYNFAIILDKQHKYDEAAALYRQIIEASQRGEVVPGDIQKIQQRLTFISSNRPG